MYMPYNIGDFIKFQRSHLEDTEGVIINIQHEKEHFWCGNLLYFVSLKQFRGDYCVLTDENIDGLSNINCEEKLSLLGSFDDWWFNHHKSIFQSLIIEALN